MIDDSALFHAAAYDPVKAREYYLRTRKLKGRRPTTATALSPGRGGRRPTSVVVSGGGKPNRADTKSRRAELLAQKAALEKRLDHLREVLKRKVEEAKKLGDKNAPKKNEKDKAPETKVDKADRNKAEKDRKPLTASEKSAKAKKAKEAYEKEHPNTLSEDVDILREQVKDIRAKIEKVIADAQERKMKAGASAALVRPQAKPNDGPRGR